MRIVEVTQKDADRAVALFAAALGDSYRGYHQDDHRRAAQRMWEDVIRMGRRESYNRAIHSADQESARLRDEGGA